MKRLTFWFDVVSPFAYLAFERLPQALEGLSYEVEYRPLLFAGLLKHWGQKGPAEIEPKRAWTFRQVHWLAHRHGVALQTPAVHPFAARLAGLAAQLAPALDPGGDEVKAALRRNGEDALRQGVFGVPTIEVEGRLFWGLDSLEMVAAVLAGDPWFDGPDWAREGAPRAGVVRR
jgi:2-hydroxychromene-2-carboxylate isomerase